MSADGLSELAGLVDPAGRLSPAEAPAYLREPRGLFHGSCDVILRPASTAQVARIAAAAQARGVRLYPRGGGSSLVGGSVPPAPEAADGRPAAMISLDRLNRIRAVEPRDDVLIAEAGCTLAQVQDAAEAAGRLFPLWLTPREHCRIGGNLATNAGGMATLRYGNARALCLGVEAVLADGRVVRGLTRLRKDNTGYDLKDLFVGAEGTLGIITAASLRLQPQPSQHAVALVGLPEAGKALDVLAYLRRELCESVTAFELMSRAGVALAVAHMPDIAEPFSDVWPWYVLVAADSASHAFDLVAALDHGLAVCQADRSAGAYRLAHGPRQRAALWRLRTGLVEAQREAGASIKHDVSVPVGSVATFLDRAARAVAAYIPDARPVPFGHVGDGNIHFNVSQPPDWKAEAFLAEWDAVNERVHDVVAELGGSIAAEHGIGQLKPWLLARYGDPASLATMRAVKRALDPTNIMNPDRVLGDGG